MAKTLEIGPFWGDFLDLNMPCRQWLPMGFGLFLGLYLGTSEHSPEHLQGAGERIPHAQGVVVVCITGSLNGPKDDPIWGS